MNMLYYLTYDIFAEKGFFDQERHLGYKGSRNASLLCARESAKYLEET